MFVQVGFFFKGNIAVSFRHPFDQVPDIKRKDQHFFLLLPVDVFMIKEVRVVQPCRLNKYSYRGQSDARKLTQIFKGIDFH